MYTDMDKRSQHLALFTLCVFFGSGLGGIHVASAGGQWCVAKQGALDTALQAALDYACGVADCSSIQPGAICYNPNTVRDHASYAFNEYYQKNPQPASCVFAGAATLTSNDPSHGNCQYASAGTSISPPTPSSPQSKPTPTTPSAGNPPTHSSPQTQQPLTPLAPNPPGPGQEASPSGATSTSSPPSPRQEASPGGTTSTSFPPSPGHEASPSGATSTSFSLMVFLACGLASFQLAKSI